MMTYTRSAIGLLTRQYKAVLKKCFLINMGLFALGAVSVADANAAAAPKPTLDDMNTKAESFTTTSHYTLDTTQGTNTHFLLLDNGSGTLTQYWYTPNEGTAEKNNILNYLAGVALKETTSSTDYVFTDGTKYYTFDIDKPRPVSTYTYTGDTIDTFAFKNNPSDIATFTAGASDNYDVKVSLNKDTTKYYNINIDITKAEHVSSKLSNINWSITDPYAGQDDKWANDYVAGSNVTVSGNTVTGAIRIKTPHNGTVGGGNVWNKYFTYTYTSPYGAESITQNRINNTIAVDGSNVKNKVFAGITSSLNGSAIYNTQDKSSVNIISDFIGNKIKLSATYPSNYTYGGAVYNYGIISSIVGDFVGNSIVSTVAASSSMGYAYTYGGAIYNGGTIGSIVGDFVGNSNYSRKGSPYPKSYGGAIYNAGTINSIVGDFIGNSSLAVLDSAGGVFVDEGYAGAVYNTNTIGSIKGNFISNTSSTGGAIYNTGTISSIKGNFISNTSSTGGAIYNTGTISSIIGDFISNTSSTGGAIYIISNGIIGSILGDFVGNKSSSGGGAMYISSAKIDSIIGDFVGNVGSYGGAIYNSYNSTVSSIKGDFMGNSATSGAGAIYNYSSSTSNTTSIGSITGDFINNSTSSTNDTSCGGAIYNYAEKGTAIIGSITGDFIGNSSITSSSSYDSDASGGAIHNNSDSGTASISIIVGDFIRNNATDKGGAIHNISGTIDSITGNFVDNSAEYGGAISNYAKSKKATIGLIDGNFTGNSISTTSGGGGAIYNVSYSDNVDKKATIDSIIGNFSDNTTFSNGGAIYNSRGIINSITGNFSDNGATSSTGITPRGGAIYNTGTIGLIDGNFEGNFVNASSSTSSLYPSGGAIYSSGGTISSIVGDFNGNFAIASTRNSTGGAIYNNGTTISSIKGDFVENYATGSTSYKAYGGAIFNGSGTSSPSYNANSIITLVDNTFTGNYVNNGGTITPNSIYNAGIINIKNGATVTINDGYNGLSSAQLNIGTGASSGSIFNLSVDNGVLQTDNLGTVTNNGTMTWDLDVSLGDITNSDKITVSSLSGTQSIIIRAINLVTGTGSDMKKVTLTNNATLRAAYKLADDFDIATNITKATGVDYTVNSVSYDNTTGILTFNGAVINTLVAMIAKDEADKEYTIAADGELVEANLATLVNNKLTVTGNGSSDKNWVKGSNTYTGVTLGAGDENQTFEVNNIAEWSGFAGPAITTGAKGALNIENAHFTGNTTADVNNGGMMNLTGTNSFDKIIGDGTTEVKSGTTTVGSLAQGTLTVTSGELKNNGASTVGGGSNAGTISGTGSLTTTGAFENKSGATISQAVNHNGTNAFTNNGTISGAVTNSGTFANNSTLSNTLTNSGTFTNGNNGTISGAVTNTGTMTSAAEKMTGSVANNAGGILNLSGALAKNISGTGTTNVNSTLAMNSGAGVAGTLNMNGGTVTISNNAITSHNVGELKGNGNIAIDINYGGTGITSDEIYVTSDAQDSTLTISSLTESGTRAANFEKQILFGTDGSTKLALSTAVLNQFNKTHDAVDMQKDSGLNTNNTLWNKTYGTEHWTEYYDRTLSVNSSGNSIVYESVKTGGTDHTWNPEYDTLALMNQYEGTGYENRKIDFTGIHADDEAQGVYTLSAALGETKAGRLTLDGEKNTTTGALTVVDLNGNAGFNLTNATELVLDEVKLTGASGNNVITASNDGASVSLNDAYVDGNIVKNGGEKMTVTTTETTTLAGNTTNVSLTNSGTLTNNGTITGDVENSGIFTNNSTITGDVTNTGTMTSSANKLGGAIANNGDGVLNLSGTLAKEITGTGTTKVDSALTLAEGAEIAGKLDMNDGTVTMSSDSKYKSYTVGTLKNSGNIAIDAKASTADTDSFALSGAESGASIHISSLTFDKSDLTEGQDYEQKMHVLTGNGSVALTLDDSIANAHKETHYKISDLKGTDSVNDKDVAWNETFGNWKKERYKDATLAVNGKDLVYTVSHTFGDKTYTSNSEGLKELNVFNAGTETKTFNAEADGKEHRIIEDLGNTVGKLSIDGKGGTLDFDGKKGFVMGSGTEVSLKDVTAKNADKLADVKSGATLNLEDVTLENNGLLQNAGTINLSGVNSIDSIITGMGADATLNVNSDWEIDTTVTGHQVNVNGVKLTVGAGNLVGSDNLNVKDGAEVDITNSHITVGDANFESGSKLSLKVNSLGDFGAFTANKIAVANKGAKLSVTLAQGIQNGSVQLLKVTSTAPEDQNFNTFEDITDNNMYIFEKADKNGLYNIRLAKTAEEIVEESGGTANEARAAGAWVDGNEFAEGTVTKEIADTLADLAQNDVQALKDALEVITPVEAPATQESLSEFSDRLMLEVNNHLSINEISGLSSGDELSGVTLWAKGYYGKSKLNSHKNIKGFDTKKKGVIAGIDKKLDNNIKVGVGFQYEDGDVDAFRRDTDINTLVGFVYSEYKPSDWFVRGVASYGSASYDESKYALGINIKDKYHADVYSLQALTGYDLKYVTPEVGARYYYIKRHGYSDNIGQQMSGNNMDLLRGVMGLRTSYRYGMFKPEIYAGITYDFVSDEDNATISLPNGENYLVNGKRLNRFGTELNASVEAYITDELSATLGYEGKFRSHYQDHSGIVNVKYEF